LRLQYGEYGLLSAFLNGMVDVAGPGVKLIDGFENAYFYLRAKEFAEGRRIVSDGVLPFVDSPEKHRRVYRCGFGIWLDADWLGGRNRDDFPADGRNEYPGWSSVEFSRNHFQPDELEISLKNALRHTDEYVWLYAERVFYWGPQKNVPDAYVQSIERARASGHP